MEHLKKVIISKRAELAAKGGAPVDLRDGD